MSSLKTIAGKYGFMTTILVATGFSFFIGLVIYFINPEYHKQFISWLALPAEATEFFKKPWTLFTYIFVVPVSRELISAIFNLLGFYFLSLLHRSTFGEERNRNFIIHLVIFNGLLYVLINTFIPWDAIFPPDPKGLSLGNYPFFGFRSVTMGMLVFGMIYYPKLKVNLYGIIPVSMLLIGAIFILLEVIPMGNLFFPGSVGILISLSTGAMYSFLLKKNGNDLSSWVSVVLNVFKKKEKETVYSSKQHKGSFQVVKGPNNPDQDEIDRILDKIGQVGYEKLTRAEKETLAKFSEKKDSQNKPGGPGR